MLYLHTEERLQWCFPPPCPSGIQWEQSFHFRVSIRVLWCTRSSFVG